MSQLSHSRNISAYNIHSHCYIRIGPDSVAQPILENLAFSEISGDWHLKSSSNCALLRIIARTFLVVLTTYGFMNQGIISYRVSTSKNYLESFFYPFRYMKSSKALFSHSCMPMKRTEWSLTPQLTAKIQDLWKIT